MKINDKLICISFNPFNLYKYIKKIYIKYKQKKIKEEIRKEFNI